MKPVNGLFCLQRPLLVRQEVLGKTLNAAVNDVSLSISFPRMQSEQYEPGHVTPLNPPDETGWRIDNKPINWGYVSSTDCMVVEVLTMQFTCEDDQVNNRSYAVYSAIVKWEKRLSQYLSLCCKHYDRGGQDIHCGLTLRSDDRNIPSGLVAVLMLNMYDGRSFATIDKVQEAIAFASSSRDFKTEYEMLLAAYEARRNNNNREVILDACTALELTVIRAIRRKYAELGLDAEHIIELKETLGSRYNRLRAMDTSCTYDIQNTVIDVRNAVMHSRNLHPTDRETDALVTAVEEVMDHYYTGYCEE